MTDEELKRLAETVEELSRKVEELERWKRERARQQLTEPLDYPSQKIVKRAAA
jgi:hypothetical protein